MQSLTALIPARAGSTRIQGKNVRFINGHPLIAYSIEACIESGIFNQIIVSTDSEDYANVAKTYGADVPFLRPESIATATSPDIEWIIHTIENLDNPTEAYAVVRPTSPLRRGDCLKRAWDLFRLTPNAESMRAVEKVRQHPGKMWTIEQGSNFMSPLINQDHLDVAWHSSQYQSLPIVYVQNSAFEFFWHSTFADTGTKDGTNIMPFFTNEFEGLSLDYEDEWKKLEQLTLKFPELLPAPKKRTERAAIDL